MITWTVLTYLTYLLVAVPLTIWVATTLSRNGHLFLVDVFEAKEGLAEAVNRLLVVGFYLVNLGFVLLYLRLDAEITSLTELLETVSTKIGIVMLVLGALHFGNVYVFNAIRRRSRFDAMRLPPVPPQSMLPGQPAYPR